MPSSLSENRTPIADAWYTSAQMDDVGAAWAQKDEKKRLYKSIESKLKTALIERDLDNILDYPYLMMLPLNRNNNHWTSIAIRIEQNPNKSLRVYISYTNSRSKENKIKNLSPGVQNEITRLSNLFYKKFGRNTTIHTEIYPHAWQQPDKSACGPYALKNAERCLAQEGAAPNPGPAALRREQLRLMSQSTAIVGCSTNNEIDEILTFWIISKFSRQEPHNIDTLDSLEPIYKIYAESHNIPLADVRTLFVLEYKTDSSRDRDNRGLTRLKELFKYDTLLQKLRGLPSGSDQVDQVLKIFYRRNAMIKIESIRKAIAAEHGAMKSYEITPEIIEQLTESNNPAVQEKLTAHITDPAMLRKCKQAIVQLLGTPKIEADYSHKLVQLSKAYKQIHKAMQQIKTINLNESEELTSIPSELLNAQIHLLNAAIARNDAKLLANLAYLLSDFCSSIIEIITFGVWKPDSKRIEIIKQCLNTSNPNAVTREQLESELESLNLLITSKSLITESRLDAEYFSSEKNQSIG